MPPLLIATRVEMEVLGALLVASLGVVYVAWERALQIPTLLLVAVHCVYVQHVFAMRHATASISRKAIICLLHTFADSLFTAHMLGDALPQHYSFRFLIFIPLFVILHRLCPNGKFPAFKSSFYRGSLYLADGYFMGVGVAQGLEAALVRFQSWQLAATIVAGKQALPAAIYLFDTACFSSFRHLSLSDLHFNLLAGLAIFGVLFAVYQPGPLESFSQVTYASTVIYMGWAAWDALADSRQYSSLDK